MITVERNLIRDVPFFDARTEESRAGGGVMRVLLVTAAMVLLIQVGAGGELALLPLLVAATVFARLLVGWLCDRIGPRLTYTWLLILGSLVRGL